MPRFGKLAAWCLSTALGLSSVVGTARADDAQDAREPVGLYATPHPGRDMNRHYYARLRRDPWRAFAWEALLPGAGSVYVGLRTNAIVTFSISVLGAGLWTAGAVLDREALWWAGASTFAAGRTYGLVSAPLGATLLNAAFRRQLQIAYRF